MSSVETQRSILRYLLSHPDAKDSIEGIMQYWIRRQQLEQNIEEVAAVVNGLVDKSILVQRIGTGTGTIYSINSSKVEEIKKLIGDPVS